MENLESTQYQDQAGMVKSRYQTNTGTSSLSSNIYLNMWAQTVNQQATFYLKQVTSLRLTDHIASCGNWHQHFLLPLSNLWPTVFPSLNGSLYLKQVHHLPMCPPTDKNWTSFWGCKWSGDLSVMEENNFML
jgi:hypothetical protein